MIPQIISFNCVLKNLAGQLISSTYNKDVLTSINDDQAMLLGLSKGLQNLQTGDRRKIILKAEEAYGFYDPKKVVYYPKKLISKDIRTGEVITIIGKSGMARTYKVIALHTDMVSLDANHPLAGQDLVFEIETLAARDATSEEIEAAYNNVSTQLLH
jgi:FKBP-type peptidyl-prolyl cis-trans isomerase SlyD